MLQNSNEEATVRAAIYARFSSDLQSPTSIADQVRECRARVDSLNGEVVEVYADAAMSGADARHRPALQRMMADARAGRFDVVVAEALDRISRDQEDTAAIHKRLSFAGVRILTLSEGDVGEMHVAFRGAMNSLFLRDLASKVRRGQRGRLEAGRNPGGICYGYRPAPEIADDGEIVRGGRAIHDAEAEVVRRIFAAFLKGTSPRTIAAELNAEGIPAPRGGIWRAGTIRGHGPRATGILRNPIYCGRLAWNRQNFVRNPDTGKRIARPTETASRVYAEAPELAIVTPEEFTATGEILAGIPHAGRGRPRPTRRGYLLSGLVICGSCGEPFVGHARGTMRCRRYVNSRSCSNTKTVRVHDLTRHALAGLKASLLDPGALEEFCREYRAAAAARAASTRQRRRERDNETVDLKGRIAKLLDLIETGRADDVDAVLSRIRSIEARLAELAKPEPETAEVIEISPRLPEVYRRLVDRFLAAEIPEDATEEVRALIDRIVIYAEDGKGRYRAELVGSIAALISANDLRTDKGVELVAAGRFELPTKGL